MSKRFKIKVKTDGMTSMYDLTPKINEILEKQEKKEGLCSVFHPGSTASITCIEFEPGLKKDIKNVFEKIIPYDKDYKHHETWNDRNGASHLRASITGFSETIPFEDQKLLTGTWQQVVLIDFDRKKREREIIITVI